jgi:hypothetical protein
MSMVTATLVHNCQFVYGLLTTSSESLQLIEIDVGYSVGEAAFVVARAYTSVSSPELESQLTEITEAGYKLILDLQRKSPRVADVFRTEFNNALAGRNSFNSDVFMKKICDAGVLDSVDLMKRPGGVALTEDAAVAIALFAARKMMDTLARWDMEISEVWQNFNNEIREIEMEYVHHAPSFTARRMLRSRMQDTIRRAMESVSNKRLILGTCSVISGAASFGFLTKCFLEIYTTWSGLSSEKTTPGISTSFHTEDAVELHLSNQESSAVGYQSSHSGSSCIAGLVSVFMGSQCYSRYQHASSLIDSAMRMSIVQDETVLPYDEYGGTYQGDLHKGIMHGKGVYVWPSGQRYEGEYKEGKKHGKGILTLADGRKYSGDFKNGQYHGVGIYTWPNGQKFKGNFKEGKLDNK